MIADQAEGINYKLIEIERAYSNCFCRIIDFLSSNSFQSFSLGSIKLHALEKSRGQNSDFIRVVVNEHSSTVFFSKDFKVKKP